MTIQHRTRIIIGLILIALGIGTAYVSTSRTAFNVSVEQSTQASPSGVRAWTEKVELVKTDLRLPLTFGLVGVGLIVSTFIRRTGSLAPLR
jgi:hypothetical protein